MRVTLSISTSLIAGLLLTACSSGPDYPASAGATNTRPSSVNCPENYRGAGCSTQEKSPEHPEDRYYGKDRY